MSAAADVRSATTAVLVAVTLIAGAVLLLGNRFDAATGYQTLTRPTRIDSGVAACVAAQSMRLIDAHSERCQPGEVVLTPDRR